MLGHIKSLVVIGTSTLSAGLVLLVVAPQCEDQLAIPATPSRSRPGLILAPSTLPTFDSPGDPSFDAYDTAIVQRPDLYMA